MALGQEANTGTYNQPGLYRDPQSGAELEVSMPAGADALVRMGWEFIAEYAEPASDKPANEITSNDTYTSTTTAKGQTQYRKNGKMVSKDVYEAGVGN